MAAAAFYDLDGTLVRTNLVHAFAFTARNQQGLVKSALKTVYTLASVPMFLAADFWNRRLFNDLFFVRYRGESEDRLRSMAQELFDTVLKPSIFPGAYELIDKSRQLGLRQVIVTGALDLTVAPLARHLKIDDYVTNRLEFVDGYATGRLLPPIMAAATKASWMRIYAEKENLNLSDCYGYSDSLSDLPMLSVVGHPTAVNPDLRLRSTALQHDWPVLDLR
ncbi:MAG TPA: HAD-IB family hydrolase [Polyangia bacterium]|jgi:HAD superfamily hydrolase (TIGR01490 family)|nr:HAD-IB family hydrolase [Polyangia bacterium]